MSFNSWKRNLINALGDVMTEMETDHPECPECCQTMNFYGHDDDGDFPYGEGHWDCPACGFSISEDDLGIY